MPTDKITVYIGTYTRRESFVTPLASVVADSAYDFGAVLSRNDDTPRRDTPEFEPRPYTPMPEPKAHQAPLGHLGRQIADLLGAKRGQESPTLETVGDAVRHFFRRENKK